MQNSSSREHQLLLNWVCIHVRHLKSAISDLTTDFLLSTSTFFDSSGSKVPHPRDRVRLNNADDKQTSFLPDGVFFIKSIKPKKALLFFVEIDMSTETIAHFKNSEKDVLQKIINYQAYFRAGGYKRYESHWNCRFKGFRLLIITNKPSRVEALSRLVAQTPPSDFIWLTDQKSLHSQGISDRIWVRGGRAERSLESIVGPTLAVPSAIPIKS